MAKRSKKEMIQEMKDMGWHPSVDENSSYEDVKDEWETAHDELSCDCDTHPNGRDFDSENFDD